VGDFFIVLPTPVVGGVYPNPCSGGISIVLHPVLGGLFPYFSVLAFWFGLGFCIRCGNVAFYFRLTKLLDKQSAGRLTVEATRDTLHKTCPERGLL